MSNVRKLALACAVSIFPFSGALAQTSAEAPAETSQTYTPTVGQEGKDVVWVPTPQELVDHMMQMANVTADDYVVDLGSGDGRTVITAARLGARAHGIEYNPELVALSQRNAEAAGVTDLATFVEGDIFESDFSEASVITLFLLSELNLRLRPILLDMEPGTRVVSNTFDMGDWEPDNRVEATGECSQYCNAYLWIIPAKVDGIWNIGEAELTLEQNYQMLSGTLTQDGETIPISDAKMDGRSISFSAGAAQYTGQIGEGDGMAGTRENGEEWSASRVQG